MHEREKALADTESLSIFRRGEWVVVTEPGPWFGKVGEIGGSVPEKLSDKGDWIVLMTAGGIGVGFFEEGLMHDPRVWK